MGLSKLQTNVKRFFAVNAKRKELEREEAALKAFFSEQAAGKDAEFTHRDVRVLVEQGSSVRLDTAKVRVFLGAKVKDYETTHPSEKITVKKVIKGDPHE